jgi:hypothetical protein
MPFGSALMLVNEPCVFNHEVVKSAGLPTGLLT